MGNLQVHRGVENHTCLVEGEQSAGEETCAGEASVMEKHTVHAELEPEPKVAKGQLEHALGADG